MILIVSTYRDFHAFAVQWALRRMGVECKILDLFRVVAGGSVTLDVVRGHLEWTCPRTESVESVSLHNIDCVWMRRGNREFDVSRVHNLDREVVQREVISLARGIEAWVGRSVPAINSPYSLGVADQKLVQLTEAAKVGLTVPPTLMSNEPNRVREFVRSHAATIFKPFHQNAWSALLDDGNYAQRAAIVTPADLHDATAIALCPGIYQPLITKRHELRVTVCGDDMVVARLESQFDEETAVDWRHDYTQQMPILPDELPDAVRQRIGDLMANLGLRFGCIDLVIDTAGDYVFLEINQQGQFLWLELRNRDIRLLQHFCAFLCREGGVPFDAVPLSIHDYMDSSDSQGDLDLRESYYAYDRLHAPERVI